MEAEKLARFARKLFKHYHAKLMAEVDYLGMLDNSLFQTLESQPQKVRTNFQKAAQSCVGVGAKPRDYIEAQFVAFEQYTQYFGKRLTPLPGQLSGLNAQVRYAQWRKEQEDEEERENRKTKRVVRGTFTIDERNLKALVRSLRIPPTDILVEKPDEFSIAFLKSKGVYTLVRARRRELRGDAS